MKRNLSRWVIPQTTSLLVILSLYLPTKAQVIIRDTVVISPDQMIGPESPLGEASFTTGDCGRAMWGLYGYELPDVSPGGTRGRLHIGAPAWGIDATVFDCRPCGALYCGYDPMQYYQAQIGPLGPGTTVTLSASDCQWADSSLQLVATSDTTWNVLFNNRAAGTASFHRGYGGLPMNPTVSFQQLGSNSVYPTYPGHNNSPGTQNWVNLEASVTQNGCAFANYSLTVQSPLLVDSGGHSHDGNRPMGQYEYPIDSAIFHDTFTGQTDSEGKLRFRYFSSQFGGAERIRVQLVSDTAKFDTLTLTTKVPGLANFGDTSSSLWNLTGAPPWNITTTYKGCRGDTIRHYQNHYATSILIARLQPALIRFFAWSGSTEGGGQWLKLGVNDMSLQKGGLFDICSHWLPGHGLHREGLSVDIDSSSAELFNNPGNFVPLQSAQIRRLTNMVADRKLARRVPEGTSIHYEFRKD